MISFPNCKINIGLRILRRRSDGYHDLESLFYPLSLCDVLEVLPATEFHFTQTGYSLHLDPGANLCVKAYHLLKKNHPALPPAALHLHKHIPHGAGLGGGSSDAAFTLDLLNKKFELGIDEATLKKYALELGSDCPFFLLNRPAIARSRGEALEPVGLSLSEFAFVLVHPGLSISTAWAFAQIKPAMPARSIGNCIQLPITQWKDEVINDFERPVFEHHPGLKKIKDGLYQLGAVYASLSGSGSSFYGMFRKENVPGGAQLDELRGLGRVDIIS